MTREPVEVALTLQRYGLNVPESDRPHVVAAFELVRGLADLLADVVPALPEAAGVAPALTLGFPPGPADPDA